MRRMSLSLDLDNLWSYIKTSGDSSWQGYPSYLNLFVPRMLDILDETCLKITFFIVGKDAEQKEHRDIMKAITGRGHEVGNHSYSHEPWMGFNEKDRFRKEISTAEEHIFAATGQKPVGFRGPGYLWSVAYLSVLAESGYIYDASTLPTFIGPLARYYYFRKSMLSAEEKTARGALFGSFRDGLKPNDPYLCVLPSGNSILEMPVTTMPVFRIPFHLSYLFYVRRYSAFLAHFYLKMAVTMCRLTGTNLSFLLHPLDLLGGDDVPALSFFPGMDLSGVEKIKIFKNSMRLLLKYYTIVGMSQHAEELLRNGNIRQIELKEDH